MERRRVEMKLAVPKRSSHISRPYTLEFLDDRADSLGRGEEGQVTHAGVVLKTRTVDGFAFKEYHNEGRALHAFKSFVFLKRAGLPVPGTFRLVKEGNRYSGILMTDLTEGWKNVLITSNQTKGYVVSKVFNHNPQTIQLLSRYNLENPEIQKELKDRLLQIAHNAAKQQIEFSADDVLSAIFHPDGEMEFIISDMGNVHLNSELEEEDLKRRNSACALSILLMISEAKRIATEIV